MDVLSAVAAIAGSLVAIVLGVAGFLVRRSLDERNADLQDQAEKRLDLDRRSARDAQEQAEVRLRLDSAVQALDLVRIAREHQAPEQAAGALFALVNLGQMDFALALLGELWSSGLVSGSAAKWVLDRAFSEADPDRQAEAARIVERHPTAFADRDHLFIPEIVYGTWPATLDSYSRYVLLLAIARSVHRVPCEDGTDVQAALVTAALAMGEPESSALDPLPHDAAQLVLAVGSGLYGDRPTVFGIRDGQVFEWETVRRQARSLLAGRRGTLQMQRVIGRYESWGGGE